MDIETLNEVKKIKASIRHYKKSLKRPAFKFTFGKEDSHDIAKRMIANGEKELKEINDAWAVK